MTSEEKAEIRDLLISEFKAVHARLDGIDGRLNAHGSRQGELDGRLSDLERWVERMRGREEGAADLRQELRDVRGKVEIAKEDAMKAQQEAQRAKDSVVAAQFAATAAQDSAELASKKTGDSTARAIAGGSLLIAILMFLLQMWNHAHP